MNVLRYGTETHPINETIVVEILLIQYCLFKSGPRIEPNCNKKAPRAYYTVKPSIKENVKGRQDHDAP